MSAIRPVYKTILFEILGVMKRILADCTIETVTVMSTRENTGKENMAIKAMN
jgi:hypothetical protein